MERPGPDVSVCVSVATEELDIFAGFTHSLYKRFGNQAGTLVVVGRDLGNGDAGSVDLTVDQEAGDSSSLSLLNSTDSGICACVVQNDGRCTASNSGIKQFVLAVWVIIMYQHQRVLAEFFSGPLRDICFRLEEGVVMTRCDD